MAKLKRFYLANEIETGLYANPGDYRLVDGTEYVGICCRVNGILYAGNKPRVSQQLVKTDIRHILPENFRYFNLTEKAFEKYTKPEYFMPAPVAKDYDRGIITRYFAQKINQLSVITEISPEAFRYANKANRPGINLYLYNIGYVDWVIKGKDAPNTNDRTLQLKDIKYPGIRDYFSDFSEFVK